MNDFQITITGENITQRDLENFVNGDAVIGRPSYLSRNGYVQVTIKDCPVNYTIASVRKTFEARFRNETIDVFEIQ